MTNQTKHTPGPWHTGKSVKLLTAYDTLGNALFNRKVNTRQEAYGIIRRSGYYPRIHRVLYNNKHWSLEQIKAWDTVKIEFRKSDYAL